MHPDIRPALFPFMFNAVSLPERFRLMSATTTARAIRKPGANRNEKSRKHPPRDANFRQSRDIREDRGERQIKTTMSRKARA